MKIKGPILIGSINLFLFILLMVVYWGYNHLEIPGWLHFTGRFHPMVLHIPIGTFIGSLILFYGAPQQKKAFFLLYDIAIISALVAAIAGLFLAKVDGYDAEGLTWHKYLGVAFASWVYITRTWIQNEKYVSHFVLGVGCLLLLISGHKGAEITHGKNYLFPENKETVQLLTCGPESSVYQSLINPIFENKCITCHKTSKRKGGLSLTDSIQLELGGDNGPVIDRNDPLSSPLITMINLPLEDDNHMPPDGKVQLTDQEISLLQAWLEKEASYHKTIASYNDVEIFQNRCSEIAALNQQKEKYSFPAASNQLIESVQNEYISLQPLHQGSPALVARSFVASEYKTQYLENLLKVKEQLVQLDLSYMPLEENDFKILTEFESLEKLSLNFATFSEDLLLQLSGLPKLQSISMAGLTLDESLNQYIENNQGLKDIYLGTTDITEEKINQWGDRFPNLVIHYDLPSNDVLPLTPPMVLNKKDIYQVEDSIMLSSPVPGAIIRYTLDGNLPDSLSGLIYRNGIPVKNITKISAIAVKNGWLSSSTLHFTGFLQGAKPDSLLLHYPANTQYPGEGVHTFFDKRKAEIGTLRDKKWIAFREKPLKLDMYFTDARSIDSLVLSYGEHIPSYVFPPSRITLLAKGPSGKWEKVADHYPKAIKNDEGGMVKMNSIVLTGNATKCDQFRLEVENLSRIPSWHQGKGEKAWLFVDEIFIY